MRIHYLQHVPYEGLGMIEQWVENKAYTLSVTRFYQTDYHIPAYTDFDALIVLGGPMSANDHEFSWMDLERKFIAESISKGKHVLGICLGAQLIAQVLGAEVTKMASMELGWAPIAIKDEALVLPITRGLNFAMNVFHWHGETFSIPEGAVPFANSAKCENQGFVYQENVLALQFHLEMDEHSIGAIIDATPEKDILEHNLKKKELMSKTKKYPAKLILHTLLENWSSTSCKNI